MRRPPYIPGALPPLDPPAILADPAHHFAEAQAWADTVAVCRRIDALATRASLAIAAIGVALTLWSVIA